MWCPKYRRPVLAGRVKARLEELIHAKADEHDWQIVTLEVMPDHVHLFVKPHPKNSPSTTRRRAQGGARPGR
ncbi:IS200/IS605 family transposase [Streptosporangium sp. NPDC051023]|uniref:IS200/IS605 family transposase n=1 Tax=Streptosporangium sp. NPDC051023 TaxID=3155410 RepID=UPI00344F6AB7